MKFKRQTEKLGNIESIQLWMLPPPKNIKKIMLLLAKILTNFLIFSLFLLTAHHPRKTGQAVENYSSSNKTDQPQLWSFHFRVSTHVT